MGKVGKKYAKSKENFGDLANVSLDEAVELIKNNASAKFDETIDIAINLGVDPKHADQMVRGVCSLPHGNGKRVRVAVFAKGEKADEAKKAGADLVGAEDLMETVQSGKIEFDAHVLISYSEGLLLFELVSLVSVQPLYVLLHQRPIHHSQPVMLSHHLSLHQ